MDAWGNYPVQPKYQPVWNALEDTGLVYGMHPFPASGGLKPMGYSEQYSGAELIRRTISTSGIPHSFLSNVQNFQAEAALWVSMVLMSGFFEKHPKSTPPYSRHRPPGSASCWTSATRSTSSTATSGRWRP